MAPAYHVWLDDEAKGPFTINQLRSMWNSGQLTGESFGSINGGADWFCLVDIVESLEPKAELTLSKQTRELLTPYQQAERPTAKKSGSISFLIVLLSLVLFASTGIGLIKVSPDGVEKADQNLLAEYNKEISTEEQLLNYLKTLGRTTADNPLIEWKEKRDGINEEFHRVKNERQTIEMAAFCISAFCFLCLLICIGINR